MKKFFYTLTASVFAASVLIGCTPTGPETTQTDKLASTDVASTFESIRDNQVELRAFLQDMPKGGDLHNHLFGAVYAENWIKWASEDGLCLDAKIPALRFPAQDGCGALPSVKTALNGNQDLRNRLIDKLSVRDFVPASGWSGHDQFFASFSSMAALPSRFGDMTADAARMAAKDHVSYIELLQTMELFETILPMVAATPMTGDAEKDYKTLMSGPFGKALPEMVSRARKDIDTAMARKDKILGCGTPKAEPACAVEIRFINQPIRTLPLSAVYAHQIFGWELMKQDKRFVATNLVAPEDDYISLRDYNAHMRQLDYLYKTLGPRHVSLHAGELWLGLVAPDDLRDHIRKAIKIGHAERIGHGTDIVFEDGYRDTLKTMKDKDIAVEISLTSSDVILGVKGSAHPFTLYRKAGVPITLSTDDEGVSRDDLTTEYIRAAQNYHLSYQDLKQISYNGLKYAFVDDETKARLLKDLDAKFVSFEALYKK